MITKYGVLKRYPVTELCRLGEHHRTDKCPSFSFVGKPNGGHSYTPFYHWLLGHTRNEVRSVLEIGVYQGGSLHMWADYFPHAWIHGVDREICHLFKGVRITTHRASQENEEEMSRALVLMGDGPFDLIIDDGDHLPEHQVKTAQILLPLLKPDGVYIIEDVYDYLYVDAKLNVSCELWRGTAQVWDKEDDNLLVIHGAGR